MKDTSDIPSITATIHWLLLLQGYPIPLMTFLSRWRHLSTAILWSDVSLIPPVSLTLSFLPHLIELSSSFKSMGVIIPAKIFNVNNLEVSPLVSGLESKKTIKKTLKMLHCSLHLLHLLHYCHGLRIRVRR